MLATIVPSPLDHWRRRFGGRRRPGQPRPWAALGYLAQGPVTDDLMEVENLTLVLVYDDLLRPGNFAVRLAGYAGSRIPWGVRVGGPGNCRFFKDLRLQPVPGGRGYRFDLADEQLLTLGLALDRELDRHARYGRRPGRQLPALPKLWAAFRPGDAASITGDGPELAAYAARTGRPPQHLLAHLRRDRFGLALLPLAWVSHHWETAVAVFADLGSFPRRQVFRMQPEPDPLVGYQDAAAFDFRSSGHNRAPRRRRSRRSPAVSPGG